MSGNSFLKIDPASSKNVSPILQKIGRSFSHLKPLLHSKLGEKSISREVEKGQRQLKNCHFKSAARTFTGVIECYKGMHQPENSHIFSKAYLGRAQALTATASSLPPEKAKLADRLFLQAKYDCCAVRSIHEVTELTEISPGGKKLAASIYPDSLSAETKNCIAEAHLLYGSLVAGLYPNSKTATASYPITAGWSFEKALGLRPNYPEVYQAMAKAKEIFGLPDDEVSDAYLMAVTQYALLANLKKSNGDLKGETYDRMRALDCQHERTRVLNKSLDAQATPA
ncbi:MAG: hypothetical protein NT051_01240 [Candidatus Micrarchaeota archaeon]|nr:hypothetical protein [Candidatus Micrarchaeota archaeon]